MGKTMKCYKIYTEQKNLKTILLFVSEKFQGFTVYKTIGYWQGKKEKSIIIEVLSDTAETEHHIKEICLKIIGYNNQDCVIYTKQDIETVLIP